MYELKHSCILFSVWKRKQQNKYICIGCKTHFREIYTQDVYKCKFNILSVEVLLLSNMWWDQFTNDVVVVAKVTERNSALNMFNK